MKLVWPATEYLDSYTAALRRGWSPDNRRPEAAQEQLVLIADDAATFLREQVDPEGRGGDITLPDGRRVPRLPGYVRWMWDGEFCGSIGFRWQPGTTDLPPHCLGHIGYAVVPWKERLGYATNALSQLLDGLPDTGLPFVELVAQVTNVASQRVIEKNGGIVIERFLVPDAHGGEEKVRFRIPLTR